MTLPFLFIVTSQATLGEGGGATGLWLEELAPPYYMLEQAGIPVLIASPRGGKAPIDPMCLGEPWISGHGKRFLADQAAMEKLEASLPLERLDGADYLGIYMVGGAGAAWDFPDNPDLGRLLGQMVAAGKITAGVCHGTAGFLNRVDGQVLAKGRRVACVSNDEERAAGFDLVVPLFPQDALTSAGAQVNCADVFEANVIVDGTFVTGQNPASVVPLGEAILAHPALAQVIRV